MVVYLAGKMTGEPDLGREHFNQVENWLRAGGEVIALNPAILPVGMWEGSYVPICMAMLEQSDAIVMLRGWEDSPGARLEKQYAEYQNKIVFYEDECGNCTTKDPNDRNKGGDALGKSSCK